MKSWPLLIAVVTIQGSCLLSDLRAGVVTSQLIASIGQDDGTVQQSPPIDCYFETSEDGYGGIWTIGQPGYDSWEWETDSAEGGSVTLSGTLDPDPEISFALGVVDFGAASNFSFQFILPLSPLVTNPSIVFDSLTGTVTNAAGSGVTVTALAPPVGIPVDGDGITELQVYTLSDNNQASWKNVGLDAGPTQVTPLGVGNSAPYGPLGGYNQGPIPTIAGGPWTDMRVDLNFRLTGGNDAFSLSGSKVLVPEPGAIVLALCAVAAAGFCRRRRS